jgi:hypothetical protein
MLTKGLHFRYNADPLLTLLPNTERDYYPSLIQIMRAGSSCYMEGGTRSSFVKLDVFGLLFYR